MGQLSTPTADLIARMDYHTAASGRILFGFFWKALPIREGESQSDFPNVRLFIPDMAGAFRPAKLATAEIEFKMIVAVAREKGLVELMKAVEKVVDALEIKTDGTTVAALAGTAKMFDWHTDGNFTVDGSLNAQLIISATPAVKSVGNRRT